MCCSRKKIIFLKCFKMGMESIQPFCSFQQSALTADWESRMHMQDLNTISVHSSLMWKNKLQHTNSWSPSWEASWMGKDKQAEWGVTLSCCSEHFVLEQSSNLLGGSRDPSLQVTTAALLWRLYFLRTRSQGNSKDQEASNRLTAKKDGAHILTFMNYWLSNATT